MTQAAILAASGSPGTTTGFKNRIINGGMTIAQRGTGTTSSAFVNQVDMFQVATNAMSFTFGQSTDAPTGFSKSGLVTNTSAVTPSGAQYFSVRGVIEGLNVADLGWGTASAKSVSLSFWVKSSVTGTFGGAIINGSFNYSYPFSYTISSANTWTQASVTIPGPTAGTWQTDNNVGMYIEWALGTGSTYQGTAGAWTASRVQGVTGQTQLSSTSGATFYLTGAQFEVGTTATNFDFRSYGTELQLCQRYYEAVTVQGGGFWYTVRNEGSTCRVILNWLVTKRATPTATVSGGVGSGTYAATASVLGTSVTGADCGGSSASSFSLYTSSAEL